MSWKLQLHRPRSKKGVLFTLFTIVLFTLMLGELEVPCPMIAPEWLQLAIFTHADMAMVLPEENCSEAGLPRSM